ncbi:MAG: VWA domain-containing protein [Myxococcales bacterium]|nr:MAG: VWA domain-containing protein [Myxococcales bacterium]
MLRSSVTFGSALLAHVGCTALLLLATACGQDAEHAPPAAEATTPQPADALDIAPSGREACVGTRAAAEALPVDLFAVLDGSSSMNDATESGVSKWYATKAAFHDFLERAPAGMGFGLSLFPLPTDDAPACVAASYREAALPIQDVSEMARGAIAKLDAVVPGGQTPTAPAYTAALELASTHALTHPERSVVVVLATDGLPTACAPKGTEALALLAEEALAGPAHVRTLVVSSSSLAASEASGFERIAAAGGTVRPVIIDARRDFSSQLGAALDATATRQVACDLALPEPPAGKRLDYDTVNVVLEGEARTTLPRVSGASACGSAGGWYYDVEPSAGAPSRLNVCKSSCERTQAAELSIELGCRTVVR